MLRRIAIFAPLMGLLFETPGGPAPTGDPAPNPNPAPAGGAPAGGAPAGGPTTGGAAAEGPTVPYERFKAANDELQKLRQAEEARQTDEQRRKGEFEKVAETEKSKREAAEARADRIGRRAAFIAAASGKVANPEAAYKLAAADGLLEGIEVDEEGNAKDSKTVDEAVANVLKRYEMLKPGGTKTDFGTPAGGNGPAGPEAPKDARSMLRLGYEQASRRT